MSKIKTVIFTKKEIEEEEKGNELRVFENEEYFTVKDIMEWLPVSATTVKKYLQTGRIEGRKLGKIWAVSRSNFYKYLSGQ